MKDTTIAPGMELPVDTSLEMLKRVLAVAELVAKSAHPHDEDANEDDGKTQE